MTTVARHVQFTARPGSGDELAQLLLAVAEQLRGTVGCDQYVISRGSEDPDVICVDERWSSAEDLERASAGLRDDPQVAAVLALLDPDRPVARIDLVPLGGVGDLPPARDGITHLNLLDLPDKAAGFGLGHVGEARFVTADLGLERTGVSLHHVRPGARQAFGHRHGEAEELYVVLSGGGRARVDDELVDLAPHDALRVGPRTVRAFEAGPEGLELLAVGPRRPGDGEMLHGWWND